MRQCIVQGFFPGQVLPYLGTQQIHILTDFVGMGVFKSSRVLAQFPRHAGHDDFAHPVFTGRGEALRDKVPDAGERRFGQRGSRRSAPDFVRPPVQNTIVVPWAIWCDFTQIRTVSI